jgi:hypothetical protein
MSSLFSVDLKKKSSSNDDSASENAETPIRKVKRSSRNKVNFSVAKHCWFFLSEIGNVLLDD